MPVRNDATTDGNLSNAMSALGKQVSSLPVYNRELTDISATISAGVNLQGIIQRIEDFTSKIAQLRRNNKKLGEGIDAKKFTEAMNGFKQIAAQKLRAEKEGASNPSVTMTAKERKAARSLRARGFEKSQVKSPADVDLVGMPLYVKPSTTLATVMPSVERWAPQAANGENMKLVKEMGRKIDLSESSSAKNRLYVAFPSYALSILMDNIERTMRKLGTSQPGVFIVETDIDNITSPQTSQHCSGDIISKREILGKFLDHFSTQLQKNLIPLYTKIFIKCSNSPNYTCDLDPCYLNIYYLTDKGDKVTICEICCLKEENILTFGCAPNNTINNKATVEGLEKYANIHIKI